MKLVGIRDGSTSDMISSVGEILAHPGPGDVVEVEIERVGAVANPVVT